MKKAILFFTLIGLSGAQAPTGTIAGARIVNGLEDDAHAKPPSRKDV